MFSYFFWKNLEKKQKQTRVIICQTYQRYQPQVFHLGETLVICHGRSTTFTTESSSSKLLQF